jgi:hypothetical protein
VHQVGHYPELHQDARSTKYKKPKAVLYLHLQDELGDFLGSILMHPYQPPARAPQIFTPAHSVPVGQAGAGQAGRKGKHVSVGSVENEPLSPAAKRSRPGWY